LMDNDGARLTSQNGSYHWPIVHPLGERAVVIMPAVVNS
jgi:hypothetical protein